MQQWLQHNSCVVIVRCLKRRPPNEKIVEFSSNDENDEDDNDDDDDDDNNTSNRNNGQNM